MKAWRGVNIGTIRMLAVERFRRPAAELGPNWLEITTGRARTDEEEVGGVQEDEEGEKR